MTLSIYEFDQVYWAAKFKELGFSDSHVSTFTSKYHKLSCSELSSDFPDYGSQFPRKLHSYLSDQYHDQSSLKIDSLHESSDGSVKFIFETTDGCQIESVLMPERRRTSLCLSSQVGCKRACSFCYTGKMGLKRNLSTAEIVDQYRMVSHWMVQNAEWQKSNKLQLDALVRMRKVNNIVFMGMGEPLDNYDNLSKALNILISPHGFAFPKSKISVSTAGHLEGIKRLTKDFPNLPIALSLHAASVSLRNKIMPINKTWSLIDVLAELRGLQNSGRLKRLLIQYTLIEGVNDGDEEIQGLVQLLSDIDCKLNLIPMNEVGFSRWKSPQVKRIEAIQTMVLEAGIRCMVRYSKAQDIGGACGQLNK